MTFELCDHEARPSGCHIILNMKNVENVSEMGRWQQQPPEPEWEQVTMEFNPETIGRPPRARPPRPRAQARDLFVPFHNAVTINSMGHNHQVIADFKELAKVLESLNDLY